MREEITSERIREAVEDGSQGFCTRCGTMYHDVEQDAVDLWCHRCETYTVSGTATLLLSFMKEDLDKQFPGKIGPNTNVA